MRHDFKTLEPYIRQYFEGKSSNSVSSCYIREKIVSCIISANKYVTNDEIYDHLTGEGVIDPEKLSKKNFPKVVGKVTQKLPFIGGGINRRVTPNVTEYHFKEAYLDIKYQIREFIENYRCP